MSAYKLLLLNILILTTLTTKNLNPDKDRAENPKLLFNELKELNANLEEIKDKFYDYMETMDEDSSDNRKQNLNAVIEDIYNFEKTKMANIQENVDNSLETLDKIFDAEIDNVIEENSKTGFQRLMVKLRKTLINSMTKYQFNNMDRQKALKIEINDNNKEIEEKEGISFAQAKKKIPANKMEELRNLQMAPIMQILIKKIDKKKMVFNIQKNTDVIILNLNERITKNQEFVDEHIQNIKNYNDLKKDPVENLKNVIFQHIIEIDGVDIDKNNVDLLINRIKDFGDAFVIVSKTKHNDEIVTDLIEFCMHILSTQDGSSEKRAWKLTSARLLLSLIFKLGKGEVAFEFITDYLRTTNGKRVKSQFYAEILLRNFSKLHFKFSPQEDNDFTNRALFLDMVNQLPNDKFPLQMDQKEIVINNFEHFFDVNPILSTLDFPVQFIDRVFTVIPNGGVDLGDNLFNLLLKFKLDKKDTLNEGVNPAVLFDVFINVYVDIAENIENLSRYYPIYKLILVLFLENNTEENQFWEPTHIQDLGISLELIPGNEELVKIVYALYVQKVPKIKREFDTIYYIESLTGQYFDMNNLNWETPEFEDVLTKNDDTVKKTIEELIGGFSKIDPEEIENNDKKNQQKINIDDLSEEETEKIHNRKEHQKTISEEDIEDNQEIPVVVDDGKNLVNVVYGEVDQGLKEHLEKSTDLRAYASEVVLEEETDDYIVQTVYVYVQRVSSPCYDPNLGM